MPIKPGDEGAETGYKSCGQLHKSLQILKFQIHNFSVFLNSHLVKVLPPKLDVQRFNYSEDSQEDLKMFILSWKMEEACEEEITTKFYSVR